MVAKNERSAGRALLAVALVSIVVIGCGGVVRPASAGGIGTSQTIQVIRDPDNPAFTSEARSQDATESRAVRDPENPYWGGNIVAGSSYVEPVRGPR
jgi:hypothetical protein